MAVRSVHNNHREAKTVVCSRLAGRFISGPFRIRNFVSVGALLFMENVWTNRRADIFRSSLQHAFEQMTSAMSTTVHRCWTAIDVLDRQ